MFAQLLAQEAEDGIASNINAADLFFLIATILFIIAFVVQMIMKPVPIDRLLITAGLACTSLGLLLL